MIAEMTLWGMYQYDNTLFDPVVLPTGMSKDALIRCIMDKCGTLYPYHQAIPQFKANIASWFSRNSFQFTKIWEALHIDYAPLENYDKHSLINDSGSNYGHTKAAGNNENTVSAYNSDNYEPNSKTAATDEGVSDGWAANEHTEYTHGNIGVTTSQAMLNEELSVREYDIYEMITTRFSHEFLLEVY